MRGLARRSPIAKARRCRADGCLPLRPPMLILPASRPPAAITAAAPAPETTGCLMMALPARMIPDLAPVGIALIAFDANPPTPGMKDARGLPIGLKIEKNPGSPL